MTNNGNEMEKELRKKLEEIFPYLKRAPIEELVQKDINYMNFLKQTKDTFSKIKKGEFEKFINEDIEILRKIVEENIDLWKKYRMSIIEMVNKTSEEVSKALERESALLIDIAISCLILFTRIDYERYKLEPERFLGFHPEYDPTDTNAAFKNFTKVMITNYEIEERVLRSLFLRDIEPSIELLEQKVDNWKELRQYRDEDYGDEIRFAHESVHIAIITNYCAYLYSLIERTK